MASIFFIEAISRRIRRRNRDKKLRLAVNWPHTEAEINVRPVDEADTDDNKVEADTNLERTATQIGGSTPFDSTQDPERLMPPRSNNTIRLEILLLTVRAFVGSFIPELL